MSSGTGLQVGILGPLDVRLDGEVLPIGRTKQRALLALLAVEVGRTVSIDRMIEELWGDEAPAKATASLQAYVSNLRRLLEPQRAKGERSSVLETEPPGYRLVLRSDQVDAHRFEALVAVTSDRLAAGEPVGALDAATEALSLWRGPVLEEFRFDRFADGVIARLEELRRGCEEDRLDAMVALGLHATAVAELEAAVRDEPLRERRWELLMVSLYRTGRHAEALARFQQFRRTLLDELGLDPSPELVELERMVLTHDAGLGRVAPAEGRAEPPATATVAVSPASIELLEREVELAALDSAIADVAHGRARILVIEGEAGAGKTALVQEAVRRAEHAGLVVGRGGCHEDGDAPALWPCTQALRALGVEAEPPTGVDAFGVLGSLSDALMRRAEAGPIVCALEDVHWADPSTLRLLGFLSVELGDLPVLLVVTARSDERREQVDPVVAALLRHPGAVHLSPRRLSAEGTDQLARRVGEGRLRSTESLHERTGGNPLFVTQLARLLAAEGPDAGVPVGVREVIARRLRRLPEEANAVLALAAVAGAESDLEVLARAAEVEVDRVADLLDAAVATGVLRLGDGGHLAFSHALVRETVLDSMSAIQRRRLHVRLARALGPAPTGLARYERAHHAVQAVPLLPAAELVEATIGAAVAADADAAFETAVLWWRHALDAVDRSSEPIAGAPTRGRLLLSLAAAYHRVGADDSAQTTILEVLDDAESRGDVGQAVEAVSALGDTGGVWLWVRIGVDPTPLLERMHRVLARLDADADAGRVRVLGTLALGMAYGAPEDADRLSAEALASARRLGVPELLARALSVRWRAIWRPGRADEQLAVGRELDALARRLGDRDLEMSAAVCLHVAHLVLAQVADAEAQLERVLAMARAEHRSFVEAQMLPQALTLALLRGELGEAERLADLTAQRWAHIEFGGDESTAGLRAILLWLLRREQGRASEVIPALAGTVALPSLGDPRWQAVVLEGEGQLDAARRILAGPDFGRMGPWYAGSAYAVLDAELAVDLGVVDVAEVAADELAPFAAELAILGTAGCLGPIALSWGRAAAFAGRVEVAEVAYRTALDLSDRNGLRTSAVWSRVRLAELLNERPARREEAAQLALAAQQEAISLGLVRAADAATALL